MSEANELLKAALYYASRGWPVFPCLPKQKIPAIKGGNGCKDATIDEKTIRAWWQRWPDANIGLHCGPASGVYVIDIDCKNNVDGWTSLQEFGDLPATVTQNTPTGGAHFLFKVSEGKEPPRNKNDFREGIDIRGESYYIMLAPSIHPKGGTYHWRGDYAPDEIELAEFPENLKPPARKVTPPWSQPKPKPIAPRAKHDNSIVDRASTYLATVDPAIQGRDGHSALLWAWRCLVVGFLLDDATARMLMQNEYNPKCTPPWNLSDPREAKEFFRKLDEARNTPCEKRRGWLLDEFGLRNDNDEKALEYGAKLASGLLEGEKRKQEAVAKGEAEPENQINFTLPPGALPPDMLKPPGLVGDLCEWINGSSRKLQPELTLAAVLPFCGALQGRKACDEWNLRTNLYSMGVAVSCAGKDHARKQLKRLAKEAGVSEQLLGGGNVTSDAAIEVELQERPAMIYLWDEIGHMMSNIKASKGQPSLRTIVPALMEMYSSSDSIYKGKSYADQDRPRRDCIEPNVCIYGTTVPSTLYQGISPNELRDGWLGRVLVFITDRDPDQDNERAKVKPVPEHLVQQVQSWLERKPPAPEGTPDIEATCGVWQMVVPTQPEAEKTFSEFRRQVQRLKRTAAREQNSTDCLWGRAEENARKIALIVACGDRWENPEITQVHALWSCKVVMWAVRGLVKAVEENVSENAVEGDKKKICTILKAAGPEGLCKNNLTRKTQGLSKRQRDEYLDDLEEAGLIVKQDIPTKTRPRYQYFRYPWGLPTDIEEQE